jgi:hypothetical protein
MTRTTNARIAGFTYLFYIVVGMLSMVMFDPAAGIEGVAPKLAAIGQHVTDVRIGICLNLLCCFSALVLAVTMYSITRDEDADLAMLGLTCRVSEGVIGAVLMFADLGLLWLGTAAGPNAPDAATAQTLGAFFFEMGSWSPTISAIFFAVGSTIFSYLLLRGRMVPIPLAWLGVLASVLLVVLLPGQLAGFVRGPVLEWMWLPALVFEVSLALWLLIKGVAMPASRSKSG